MGENRGLSLVELLITIAILSIVLAIATSFMITGSRSFAKGSADANLQGEAELTVNQVEDMIIDVNGGISKKTVPDGSADPDSVEVTMYHAEDDGSGTMVYTKEVVEWKKADRSIYCGKWDVSYDASADSYVDGAAVYENQLLAENVEDFDVDLSDTMTKKALDGSERIIVKSVQISVGYEDGTGRVDYATSPVITLRNRMLLSDNMGDIFEETTPMADTMKLRYSGTLYGVSFPETDIINQSSEVERGYPYNIYAVINSGSNVNDLVDWEIEESNTLSTIDQNGYLSVSDYEPNMYLTITARYKSNPNKKATGVVKVVGDLSKSLKSVHIRTKSLEAFAPKYGSIVVTEGFTASEEAAIIYQWTVIPVGTNRDIKDIVQDYSGNGDSLDLSIKKDPANFGIMLEITLTAHSDITGQTVSDRVNYRIDDNGAVDGDSNMERGKLVYGSTFFKMSDKWAEEYQYSCYFCDVYGNRISEYDSLLGYLELVPSSWDTYRFSFTSGLPRNRDYYVKVVCNYKHTENGIENNWTCERIHYIAAVQLYGKTWYCKTTYKAQAFDFEYSVEGYWENAWAESNPPVYEYSIEEFEYSAPAGVVITPYITGTATHGDDVPIYAWGKWDVQDWSVADEVELQSMKIKISMKDNPEIYTYTTIIFE